MCLLEWGCQQKVGPSDPPLKGLRGRLGLSQAWEWGAGGRPRAWIIKILQWVKGQPLYPLADDPSMLNKPIAAKEEVPWGGQPKP